MGGGRVISIHSKAEWAAQHSANAGKAIIVDFSAEWCGPCKMMAPLFGKLSEQYGSVIFLNVDVDEVNDVAGECGVSAMPTFQVWKDGVKVDELIGASQVKLEQLVAKHAA